MAGTSQMLDIQQRDFSPHLATGIPRRLFPRLVEAGNRLVLTEQRRSNARLYLGEAAHENAQRH